MRLVLVDNLLLEDGRGENLYLQPHLGLISLIAVAKGAGHSAMLYDPKLAVARGDIQVSPSLYGEIAARLLALDPDVVGFTSLGCNFICTLKIAQYLKAKRPHLPILLGGPHATILDREILSQFPQFDVIVRNEAEQTLLPVLEQLPGGDLGSIPGITYRSGRGVTANPGEPLIADLDSLPWPAFDSYPIASLGLAFLSIEAGRGCPFKCSFCSTATFFGRRYRLKSPQRICAEMDYLHAQYGFTHFGLSHDLFTVDRRKVLAFCQYIRGKGYTWKCSARMDCVDDELLEEMAAAGCRAIYFGVETGSPRMQKLVDKHLNLALVGPRLATTRRLGMATIVSFITGFPEEEKSDQDETLDLMGSCLVHDPKNLTAQLHLLTPEPGTGLTRRFGDSLEYDGHITEFTFPTLENDDGSVMRSHPDIFMNHHYYPTVLPRRRHVQVTSIYHALQSFDSVALAHLIRSAGGRLSRLLDDIELWIAESGRATPYDEELVCAYIEQRWAGHYLASLFRYLDAVRTVGSREPSPVRRARAGTADSSPGSRLLLSPRARLLRRIHHAPRILEFLEASAGAEDWTVPLPLRRRRVHLLVFAPEGSTQIQMLELNRRATEMVQFLASSRSVGQLREFARSLEGDPESALAFARRLLDLGAVVDASDRKERAAVPVSPLVWLGATRPERPAAC